jgi:hypothetical protein
MPSWETHPGYPVSESGEMVKELRETNRLLRHLVLLLSRQTDDNVTGGTIARVGDNDIMGTTPVTPSFPPLEPGVIAKFLVTPTFSGAAFALVGAQAAVTSSDTTNFPVTIDLADDPTGATIEAVIPATAAPLNGSESITVTWTYTNTDGTVATVTGTVTEVGIVDDVTGGTFARVA